MENAKEKRAVLGQESAFLSNNYSTNSQVNYIRKFDSFKSNDSIIKHQVYDCLLSLLENKKIRHIKSNQTLPFIFHSQTKKHLREQFDLSFKHIENLENSILRDVESMNNYQIFADVPYFLYKEFEKLNATDKLLDARIVPIPNENLNALICAKLLERFSLDQILAVDGFVLISSYDEIGNRIEAVRLDIDAKLCKRGFMMPVKPNGVNGSITDIKIFRYHDDENPFILRSRKFDDGGQSKW